MEKMRITEIIQGGGCNRTWKGSYKVNAAYSPSYLGIIITGPFTGQNVRTKTQRVVGSEYNRLNSGAIDRFIDCRRFSVGDEVSVYWYGEGLPRKFNGDHYVNLLLNNDP